MRAAVVSEFGPISTHQVCDVPDPQPGAGSVQIAVQAVAVNFVDSLVVTGKYQFLPPRPFSPGKLPAGIVTAVGPAVTDLKVGDRVQTLAEHGGYAQKVVVDSNQCFELPASMSFAEAASMALVYDTSWFGLRDRARLQPGETVLVLGASGGVGFAAVQLAKAMGARVFAGISRLERSAEVMSAGAEDIIDLSAPNLRESLRDQVYAKISKSGVDVIIDPVGGDVFDAAIRALAWRGRLVVIGFASGRIPEVKLNYILLKNIEITGLQVSDYRKRTPDLMKSCIREIYDLYEHGKLKPAPYKIVPLEAFASSLEEVVDRKAQGRIILAPNS